MFELAAAVTKPLADAAEGEPSEARAVVVGDVGYLSDILVSRLRANLVFGMDSFKWLTHDEEITGEVESEEGRQGPAHPARKTGCGSCPPWWRCPAW